MKILKTMICAVLLVAGLCGCEKLVQEINLDNLEGSWQKEYEKGVQDAARSLPEKARHFSNRPATAGGQAHIRRCPSGG